MPGRDGTGPDGRGPLNPNCPVNPDSTKRNSRRRGRGLRRRGRASSDAIRKITL